MAHGSAPHPVLIAEIVRVDFKPATKLLSGYIRFAVPGEIGDKPTSDRNGVNFPLRRAEEFAAIRASVEALLVSRGPLTDEEVSEIESKNKAATRARIDAITRNAAGAIYAGHIVDYKGYRYGLGLKRPIAGATAEFESGADRSRPTLTRIGGGALLAGPVGAIAGGMFKKDKTKGYVTIVFSDGATVIVEGPAKDEKKMREFASGVTAIAAAEARREGPPVAPEVVSGESPADQLLKLKQLRDASVLSEEQYEVKAAPLLAQL